MKILIDGMNFELIRGSGIKTYSRSLIKVLSKDNNKITILSEKEIKKNKYVRPLDGYIAQATQSPLKNKSIKTRIKESLKIYKKNIKGEIQIDDNDQIHLQNFSTKDWENIRSIDVQPNIFTKAFIRAGLSLGLSEDKARKRKYDIFILTSPIPLIRKNTINILTIHDIIPLTHPWLIDRWSIVAKTIGYTIEKLSSRVDHIICVSETSKTQLIKKFNIPREKITVLYQPCKYSFIPEILHQKKEDDIRILKKFNIETTPYILFTGAIEPKKNLLSLLKTIQIYQNLPKLIIIGSFAWSCNEEKKLISQMKNQVEHFGYLPDHELNALQRNASAFIFPSVIEGFGLPALEAMWLGVPCVLSDIEVFHELFENHATYIDPFSPKSIAEGIEQAMQESQEQIQSHQNFAKQKFSLKQFQEGIQSVISNQKKT